ncbi:MAG: methyltransferase domain-containing protein [Bdellovibrionota bacterium]
MQSYSLSRVISLLFILFSLSSEGVVLPGCDIVMGHSSGSGVHWASSILTGAEVTEEAEIHRIAGLALVPGPLNTEVQKFLASMGGLKAIRTNPKLWDIYLRLYDGITPFCSEYQELIQFADANLPQAGKIADLGGGTGPFSAWLLLRARNREVYTVDMSTAGLALAREKLQRVSRHLGGPTGIFDTMELNLLTFEGNELSGLSGAVMNNVLYNLPLDLQLDAMKKLRAMMLPGATLVVADPNGDVVTKELLEQAAKGVAIGAVKNGAKPTDFDIALGIYINIEILRGGIPPFRPAADLEELFQSAGFKVKKRFVNSFYFGLLTVLVLEA